jgi:hypothetical protein
VSTIYKIIAAAHWQAAQHDGVFRGSAVDLRDGFIHFSTAEQVEETAAKHFAGQHDLLRVSMPTNSGRRCGGKLRVAALSSRISMASLRLPLSQKSSRCPLTPTAATLCLDSRRDFLHCGTSCSAKSLFSAGTFRER